MLPKVRTSDGFMIDWNKEKIIDQLIKESSLAKKFFDVAPMTKKEGGMLVLLFPIVFMDFGCSYVVYG